MIWPFGKKLPKKDDPPDKHFDTTFDCDLHAVFVLLIVKLGVVYDRNSLDLQYGHDLRPGSLTKAITEGYVRLSNDEILSITPEGEQKLLSMEHSGLLCKGTPK